MDDFKAHFRMSRETFQTLLIYLQHLRNVEDKVPFQKKLLFSIWILAKQESFLAAGDRFNLAKSTGHHIFLETISQIAELRREFIIWPNDIERQYTWHYRSYRRNPHIAIKAPQHNFVDYYNRNNYHSVILQAVCNDRKEFIDVFAGIAGRVHDARVFRQSPLFALLTGNDPPIHENQHLLGDNAYPLLPFLMKPYRDNGHLTSEKTRFND
ncbi:protein ALP1-like [Camponotus floridanus]|uniref:protein ALP1-like n=1 Tax=Camponotus floridanus TaxID=104421 RepID=UPI000DC6A0F2|nr:protein ALP1-like [Camponotus floridanus]